MRSPEEVTGIPRWAAAGKVRSDLRIPCACGEEMIGVDAKTGMEETALVFSCPTCGTMRRAEECRLRPEALLPDEGSHVLAPHPETWEFEPGVVEHVDRGLVFVRFDDEDLRPTHPMEKGVMPFDLGEILTLTSTDS